jgi:hypothetical protein
LGGLDVISGDFTDDEFDTIVTHLIATLAGEKVPQHDSIRSGDTLFREMLFGESVPRCLHCCRMTRSSFRILLKLLEKEGGLKDGVKISVGEK